LKALALQIRRDVLRMVARAGSGHPGGALGAADILAVLYGHVMDHDPDRLKDPARDRFVLSNGHVCAAYYAALARSGYFPIEELATLRRLGSRLQGHPARVHLPDIVETSSGPLGQGLSVANGIALARRLDGRSGRVFCLVGDGEMQEGLVWEALLSAAQNRLGTLMLIVSDNGLQIDGEVIRIKTLAPIAKKLAAFNWAVSEVDGHDIPALVKALDFAPAPSGSPRAVVATTVMSRGVPFMENDATWHGNCPTAEQTAKALRILGSAEGFEDFPVGANR
jgi:transketolase